MKYANRVMADEKIKSWLERYSNALYWKEDYKRAIKEDPREKTNAENYICLYPHEFLFLICNSKDRNEYVFLLWYKENIDKRNEFSKR